MENKEKIAKVREVLENYAKDQLNDYDFRQRGMLSKHNPSIDFRVGQIMDIFKDAVKIDSNEEFRKNALIELAEVCGKPFDELYNGYLNLKLFTSMSGEQAFDEVYSKYSKGEN